MARTPGMLQDFLAANPLPERMDRLLAPEFRAFCLLLNALKQWVAAEQSATDRYLLGAAAREMCKAATDQCLITGHPIGPKPKLHHPVRDGRPPIPLTAAGHDHIEGQTSMESDDPIERTLISLRRTMNRSWARLRCGCLEHLGEPSGASSKRAAADGQAVARKISAATKLSYEQILAWLDERGL